jgi:undecaprenyl diphosphate synthase
MDNLDLNRLPKHIAIIMDGNGRWAQEKGQDRLYGHFHGVQSVRNIVEAASEIGIKYLTLYAFSTENWDRPAAEVAGLMSLFVDTIAKEVPDLHKNNIKLHFIGNLSLLPDDAKAALENATQTTAKNTGLELIIALSYSSRWELIQAIKNIAEKVRIGQMQPEDIAEATLEAALSTS